MIVRDETIQGATLKKGELYKRCTLIDCTNEGAILDECVVTSGTPYQTTQPETVIDEPIDPNL